jgi:transposase-like protein
MTCPNCGGALTGPTFVNFATPPYVCHACHRIWWTAELTPAARAAWRPQFLDYGYGAPAQAVVAAIAAERAGGSVI